MPDDTNTLAKVIGSWMESKDYNYTRMGVGTGLGVGGLIGALSAHLGYGKITHNAYSQLGDVHTEFNTSTDNTIANYDSAIASRTSAMMGETITGLKARGITDPNVHAGALKNLRAGLSGAYAAAHAALQKAKYDAKTKFDTVKANYTAALAERNFEIQKANYARKVGLWGAVSGAGAALLGPGGEDINTELPPDRDYTKELGNMDMKFKPSQFRMYVKDSPFRMKGVE